MRRADMKLSNTEFFRIIIRYARREGFTILKCPVEDKIIYNTQRAAGASAKDLVDAGFPQLWVCPCEIDENDKHFHLTKKPKNRLGSVPRYTSETNGGDMSKHVVGETIILDINDPGDQAMVAKALRDSCFHGLTVKDFHASEAKDMLLYLWAILGEKDGAQDDANG
jgi:hypothetical protein